MIWLKPATLTRYLPGYDKPFLGFAAVWLVVSLLSGKYRLYNKPNFSLLLSNIFRTNVYTSSIILVLIFVFKRFSYSRSVVLGTIILASLLELVFALLITLQRKYSRNFEYSENFSLKPVSVSPKFDDSEVVLPEIPELNDIHNSIEINLQERYLLNNQEVFHFIKDIVPIHNIEKSRSLVLNTHTFFNVENIEASSQKFFLNLHKVNDYRRVNRYFIQINENLEQGGFFVGTAETIKERYFRFNNRFPPFLASIFYAADFTFKRIIPKLPILKAVYFALTKGENRALSYTEVLGRLYYCGFKVLATKDINFQTYYIAVKIKKPVRNGDPSYGPFIKLRRVGKNGQIINVYKFRTMHPYSEFLQKYVFDKSNLEEGGKLKDDFRITSWGKVFRKLWIDELPQFINFFRGEIGLMGVRALSEHYYSLYPKDVQELRCKFKPGLVPPYYADMPTSFEEIVESERVYLLRRMKHPISTQVIYFCRAWWNILVRKARSQ